jgi:hypothetical protein
VQKVFCNYSLIEDFLEISSRNFVNFEDLFDLVQFPMNQWRPPLLLMNL